MLRVAVGITVNVVVGVVVLGLDVMGEQVGFTVGSSVIVPSVCGAVEGDTLKPALGITVTN